MLRQTQEEGQQPQPQQSLLDSSCIVWQNIQFQVLQKEAQRVRGRRESTHDGKTAWAAEVVALERWAEEKAWDRRIETVACIRNQVEEACKAEEACRAGHLKEDRALARQHWEAFESDTVGQQRAVSELVVLVEQWKGFAASVQLELEFDLELVLAWTQIGFQQQTKPCDLLWLLLPQGLSQGRWAWRVARPQLFLQYSGPFFPRRQRGCWRGSWRREGAAKM